MATEAGTLVRFAAPDEGRLVLRGTPGHLRGEVDVTNDGPAPVLALPAATASVQAGSELRFGNPAGAIVAAGAARRVKLHASIDRTTPPGSYAVEFDVAGQTVAATIEVIEQVSISLSPSSVVVDGVIGSAGSAGVLATNLGNVPLAISGIGPVPLDLDGARSTFLDRLLGRQTVISTPTTVVTVHVHTEGEPQEPEEDDRPRVSGTLAIPVVVQPGESERLDFDFTIDGELEDGRRYRALAPCYTADLEIVVVPRQDVTAVLSVAPRRTERPATKASKSTSKRATAKRPAASKRPAKKPAAGKRTAGARPPSKKKAAARTHRPNATED